MASQLEIYNRALIELGERDLLTSLDDTESTVGVLLDTLYPSVRDQLLESYQWSFATKRVQLQQTTEPVYGYEYAYTLPSDRIRIISASPSSDTDDPMRWEIEAGRLLTDEEEVYIRYIWRVEETGRFTSLFTKALIYELAAALALPITKKATIREAMSKLAMVATDHAQLMDAAQEWPHAVDYEEWINARA